MSPPPLALLRGALLPPLPDADSVLVEHGRIARIGRAAEVRAAAPRGTRLMDLGGRTLSVGFWDAHFHFLQTGIKASHPSLATCASLEEVLERVRDTLSLDSRSPLVFEEWDETGWPSPEPPTRALLDQVAPERAVILRRVDDHTAVAGTRALELLERVWPGSGIDRDTGVCREGAVLLLDELFPPEPEEVARAFSAAAELCFSVGVTTASDFLRPDACRAYARHRPSTPCPRIDAYAWVDCLDEEGLLEDLPGKEWLRLRGIKAWADGSIGAREAALFEDYRDRPGARGSLTYSDQQLRGIVRRGHDEGRSVAVHAIGDRAIAQVVDAFAELPAGEIREARHRIEHFELPRPEDIQRVAELGVRPCVQPNFVGRWAGSGGLYERALGPERLRRMNPLRTLVRSDTGVFFGSDGMPASPLFGIRSAVHHPVEEERLDLLEAHRLYTEEPARALGEEDFPAISVGSRADLVVLPAPPGELLGAGDRVDLTVLAGEVVHARLPLEEAGNGC